MERGEDYCPHKDDVPLIKQKMCEADGIIFASPVYVGDVSSMMKALIDRLAYMCHRQELADKCALIIASVHSSGLGHTIQTMGAAVFSWGLYFAGKHGFRVNLNDTTDTVAGKYHKPLAKLSKNLFDAVEHQKFLFPSVANLLIFRIQQKYRSNPNAGLDATYWHEKGWSDPRTSYYFPHNAGKGKVAAAKFLFKIVDGIFIRG
jgi:multimeric flavodoxin WrbA